MNDKRKILEFFAQQKDYANARITEGIEKYRKGTAEIIITDENGTPLPNVSVKVKQKTHEFRFGANLFLLDELETEERNQTYRARFADVFNMATLPFYWCDLEPERGKPRYAKDSPPIYRRPAPDRCIEYCLENGIEPREHALAYEWQFPEWLYDAEVDEVKKELERRYQEISQRYADKIPTIEVTNELDYRKGKSRTKFFEEPDYFAWCMEMAAKYFPNNQLATNEFTQACWEHFGRYDDKYYAYLQAALMKGTRIDAIGMQYHLFYNQGEELYQHARTLLNPKKLYHQMDLYATLGRPLQITEVTIPAYSWAQEDEELQAQILEKLYSIWFSHPHVEQIIYWNLVDGYAYVPSKENVGDMTVGENVFYGGLLHPDLSAKPAFTMLKELTQKRWHTEEEIVSDENGVCSFRGFYGDYALELDLNGKTIKKTVSLYSKDDNKIKVVL